MMTKQKQDKTTSGKQLINLLKELELRMDWLILLDFLLVALLEKMLETEKWDFRREWPREISMGNPRAQQRVKWLGYVLETRWGWLWDYPLAVLLEKMSEKKLLETKRAQLRWKGIEMEAMKAGRMEELMANCWVYWLAKWSAN